uniref:NADH-ubiquinone oxidoreductase chain 6 n=1 Tax=Lednia tumana TaxID=466727 RepID=A0A4D6Q127_9NEOP|nr:NADH dehydrogenase subunit 6 [Lednia tumana]QCF39720.1 NADH dehydrogenase subunit 6 [Lednia tumana]WOL43209.1 NADH dehydrogenase subunit 6 [Lednia tumana]
MCQLIIVAYSIITSIIFTQMTHPLAMGLMLLLQTVIISLLTGMMAQSFWFSYILFLVFLGGVLVLFIYVTSLASNEMFSMSMHLLIPTFLVMSLLAMAMIFVDFSLLMNTITNSETLSIIHAQNYQEESVSTLMKLYNSPTGTINLALVLYLFLTLIAVVKITKITHGPLRKSH